jgi:transposase
MTVPGSINTEAFLTYVTQVLAPQLWKGAIVVMDNLKVHHAERVRVAIESVGALIQVFAPLLSRFIFSGLTQLAQCDRYFIVFMYY